MNRKDYEHFKPNLKGKPRKRNIVRLLDPRLQPAAPRNLGKKLNVTKKTYQ